MNILTAYIDRGLRESVGFDFTRDQAGQSDLNCTPSDWLPRSSVSTGFTVLATAACSAYLGKIVVTQAHARCDHHLSEFQALFNQIGQSSTLLQLDQQLQQLSTARQRLEQLNRLPLVVLGFSSDGIGADTKKLQMVEQLAQLVMSCYKNANDLNQFLKHASQEKQEDLQELASNYYGANAQMKAFAYEIVETSDRPDLTSMARNVLNMSDEITQKNEILPRIDASLRLDTIEQRANLIGKQIAEFFDDGLNLLKLVVDVQRFEQENRHCYEVLQSVGNQLTIDRCNDISQQLTEHLVLLKQKINDCYFSDLAKRPETNGKHNAVCEAEVSESSVALSEDLDLFREHWNAVFAYAADMQVATDFLIDSCEQWNIIEAALIQLEADEETDKSEKSNTDPLAANENATSSSQAADDKNTAASEDELFMKSIINVLANECQHIIQEAQRKALLDRVASGGTESHSIFEEFVGEALIKTLGAALF